MSEIVMWSEADHQKRAELLAQTFNAACYNIKTTKPVKVADADTLIFWGHGDKSKFCELPAVEFLNTVSAWVSVNKGIRTVEMISCNLRHRQGTHGDPYTLLVVKKMKQKHAKITFKALPVAITRAGVSCENSILKWHPGTQTWAYVGTPGNSDKYMWNMCHLLEDNMPPRGAHTGYFRAHNALVAADYLITHKFGKDQTGGITNTDACSRNHMLCLDNNAYVATGAIGTLRWYLVEIK